MSETENNPSIEAGAPSAVAALQFGWWGILVFLSLGVVLEILHGFKVQWYLHPDYEVRHLMGRLAHAHGTGLSLLMLGFGATLNTVEASTRTRLQLSGVLIRAAVVLVPGGFLLGGLWPHGADPGLGIVLVPIGALALFVAVLRIARTLARPAA